MKRALMALTLTSLVLVFNQVGVPVEAQSPNSLQFFKNYFVTGDYVVGGTGLRNTGVNGLATGSIAISGVPEGADIQAAYLYWQVVSTTTAGPDSGNAGVTFKNIPLETPEGPTGKVLGPAGSAPCWASGGGTGSGGGSRRTYTYRADVLRYFDVDTEGKIAVNGNHAVQVPDSGPGGNATPIAMGASLVVVYRDTDTSAPLSAIVIYDGSLSLDNSNRTLTQTIQGFYQPATHDPNAKITYIVGSGQANKNENLFFEGTLLAANPFGDTAGASWDNRTYAVNPGTGGAVTTVLDTNVGAGDCLSLGAMVFKTAVQDSDGDGLLDVWETSTVGSEVIDPNGQKLPPLGSMGAVNGVKDIFVEIGYLKTDVETSYGGVTKPAHSHLPTHEALKLVGDAFNRQPGMRIHFDVGPDYPFGDPLDPSKNADAYIIRGAGLARGGEAIDELAAAQLCEGSGAPWDCQFSDYPGTVGWKTGFRYLRDEVLSGEPPPGPGEEDVCDLPGNTCERRFDRNRKDIFHYALFAHALGLPRSEAPCLDAQGHPTGANALDRCDVSVNPDFRIPRTTTGVGDFPGGDVLVTLGAFPDTSGLPLGTPFMQASTLMHELGHNFERRHSGEPSTPTSPNPNCKPTYLSVMNYLYQLRGLLDDSGKPNLDFSGSIGSQLNEKALTDGALYPSSWPYRIGWYAPLEGSYLEGQATAAKKHCDGSNLLRDEEGNLTEPPMIRIDARRANGVIDWNANGVVDSNFTLDINFNGRTTFTDESTDGELLRGSNDWANLRLNQVGSRRSVGGLFIDAHGNLRLGMMSLDSGRGDYGRGDYGRGDYGRGDYGRGDYGRGDLGRGDYGRGDYGRGDYGRGDYGRGDYGRGDYGGGDLFIGDPDNIGGELDYEMAGDLAKAPPNELTACVVGVGGCTALTGYAHDVRTDFKAPNVGGVSHFVVYRVDGPELLPGVPWIEVGTTPAVSGQTDYTVVDSSLPELLNGEQYTYFAVAVYEADDLVDAVRSDVSNLVTIDPAVNDDPTISNIPDQTIAVNTVLGPLGFTIGDERLFRVALTGSSSNTTLVPNANIVFGGSDANRTITVTPALNQSGTTTISVTVTDGAGYTATDTFVLTVESPTYTFTGFLSPMVATGTESSPSNAGVFSYGKAIPLKWTLTRGGVVVSDLGSLQSLVAVPGNYSSTGGGTCAAISGTPLSLLDPTGRPTGNSTYRFSSGQFIFNWDTSATVRANCYTIRLTLNDGSPVKATIIRFR